MTSNPQLIQPRRSKNLATTLATTFVVLSVSALLAASLFQIVLNFRTAQDAISTKQQVIAQEAGDEVSSFVTQAFDALELAGRINDPFAGTMEDRNNLLQSLLGFQPAFREVALLDSTGQEIAKRSRFAVVTERDLTSHAGKPLFMQVSQGQQYISSVAIDQMTSEPRFKIAVPLYDLFGDFQGALTADVNLKFMWTLVDSLQIGENGVAYVVDREGRLLALGNETSRVLRGERVSYLPEVADFMAGVGSDDAVHQARIATGIGGDTVLVTHTDLENPAWAVVVELPVGEAYRPIFITLGLSVAALLVVAALAAGAGLVMARRLARPLLDLTAVAVRIAEGESDLQAPLQGPTEVSALAQAFNRMTDRLRDLIGSLEDQVNARTQRLETAASLGERLNRILDLDDLLMELVGQVKDRFGYYHAHVYMLDDERRNLMMAAGAGKAGREMKAQGHQITLAAEASLVARAARTGRIIRIDDVRQSEGWLPNPLLPDTQAEMAVPIIVDGEVVGVLDVQSDRVGGLDDGDAGLLRTLANQVAVAIRNARLFAEVERSLAEAKLIQAQYLQEAWESSQSQRQALQAEYQRPGTNALARELIARLDQQARTQSQPALVSPDDAAADDQPALIAPIRLQDQVIGTMQFLETEQARRWDEQELALVRMVAEQVAQTAENLRLFEATRQQAGQEQTIREITDKLRAAPTLDALLDVATRELGQALHVRDAVLELGIERR